MANRADGHPDARSRLSRRRALQIGAGAAFSAPTITSLATTPAYAACSSVDLVLDSFAYPQATGTIESDSSFLFDSRWLRYPAAVLADFSLEIVGTNSVAGVQYQMAMGAFADLGGCSRIVLQGCDQTVAMLLTINQTHLVPGAVSSPSEISFDVSGIPGQMASVSALALSTAAFVSIKSYGPLVAQA
ncbi:MAG: hypothetical protein GY926_04905 [bacterium]|nr:hypothetical protein [bacterium]